MNQPTYTLAIESAVAGGSLSLLRGGVEIANWIGSSDVSKAEELLVNIDAMLRDSGVSPSDLGLIAVSAGPGSFTGIRIGIATALGLKMGLGIEMASRSVLDAIAAITQFESDATVVLPMRRNAVCIQRFTRNSGGADAIDAPATISLDDLNEMLAGGSEHFLLHRSLYEKFDAPSGSYDLGANLAFAIGSLCEKYPATVTEPLLISKSF